MSTRRERRAERRKERKQGRASTERSFPWFTALVVAVVLVFGFLGARALGVFEPSATTTAGGPIDVNQFPVGAPAGQKIADMGREHLKSGERFTAYNSTPPTSGPHDPVPVAWGVYDSAQPDERLVHSLEHGGVVIYYNGISDDDLAKLKSLRSRYPRDQFNQVKVVITPYTRIGQGEIALTAWSWLDKMQGFDERRILAFLRAHLGQCCENVP